MIAEIVISGLIFIFIIILNFINSNNRVFITWAIIGIVISCIIITNLVTDYTINRNIDRNINKHNTEIIKQYQQKDYSLEIKIEGDKRDTLYIFK